MNVLAYNLTWMDTSNTLPTIIEKTNDSIGGYLIIFILIVLFVMVLVMYETSLTKALMGSGFITTIIAILFSFSGLLYWAYAMIPLSLMVVGIVLQFLGVDEK